MSVISESRSIPTNEVVEWRFSSVPGFNLILEKCCEMHIVRLLLLSSLGYSQLNQLRIRNIVAIARCPKLKRGQI